ncbi:MAG: TfoX/Sxy family protein [archaeon]|nr:TfoX/Sxy family protein [archaeon]
MIAIATEELVNFLSENLKDVECQSRKMFGYPVYFINNNMFIGVHQEDLFLRLAADDKENALTKYEGIKPFEPMPGRIMKEYVVIPPNIYTNPEIFKELLTKSIRYVSSLPPKEKKRKKKKKV